jgi:hypothetical protein
VSFFLHLVCRLETPVSRSELARVVADGSFFANPPFYEPSLEGDLGELTIRYNTDWSIEFARMDEGEGQAIVAEAAEFLDSASVPQDARERLHHLIQQTRCVIEVAIDRAKMDPTAWDVLDAMEAHIMRSRQGLLYVYSEGIYGPNLQLWSTGD